MLTIYKTIDGRITEVESIEKDTWINLVAPTDEELQFVSETLHVEDDFLKAALDEEEISRVELDDETGQALITVDVPLINQTEELLMYSTLPVGIIETQDNIITVCLQNNTVLDDFTRGCVKHVFVNLKSRFIFQFLYLVATRFLIYLRHINRMSNRIEKELHRSMKNKELIQLYDLKKSLVYFSTSLKSNQLVVEKLQRGRIVQLYEDDRDLLDDVLIEMEQAIEMSNIYGNILSGTMDAFASIISNNLNVVMKILTSLTILMSIPTMISSFYGMNISGLPFPRIAPVMVLTIVATLVCAFVLYKFKMFNN